jgi:predicted nucleic-acid-binding protein
LPRTAFAARDDFRAVARFIGLIVLVELEIEDEECVDRALGAARAGADFAEALIGDTAEPFGYTEIITFDRRVVERLGWRLLV